MQAYAVQYKDKAGFICFAPTENGQLPIFDNINSAQAFIDNLSQKLSDLLAGTPIFEKHMFRAKKIVGYNKPDKLTAEKYQRMLKTLHIGQLNVATTYKAI